MRSLSPEDSACAPGRVLIVRALASPAPPWLAHRYHEVRRAADERRECTTPQMDASAPTTPRFAIGTAVECNMGPEMGWLRGTVVAHDYLEKEWLHPAPYQVRLEEEDGGLIYAPEDDDKFLRVASTAGRKPRTAPPMLVTPRRQHRQNTLAKQLRAHAHELEKVHEQLKKQGWNAARRGGCWFECARLV